MTIGNSHGSLDFPYVFGTFEMQDYPGATTHRQSTQYQVKEGGVPLGQFAWLVSGLWESSPSTDASSQWKACNLSGWCHPRARKTLALTTKWIFSAFAINFPFRCSWDVDGYRPNISRVNVYVTKEERMERPHLRPGQLNTWPLDYWHHCEVVLCIWNQARNLSPGRPLAGKGSQGILSSRKADHKHLLWAAELSNKCKCLQQTKQFLYLEFTNEMCGILYRAKMWLFPNIISKCIEMGCPDMREAHKNLVTSKPRCGQLEWK